MANKLQRAVAAITTALFASNAVPAQAFELPENRRDEVNRIVNGEVPNVVLRDKPNFASRDTTASGQGYVFTQQGHMVVSDQGSTCSAETGYAAVYAFNHNLKGTNSNGSSVNVPVTYVEDREVFGYYGSVVDVNETSGSMPAKANITGSNPLSLTQSWATISRGDYQIWASLDGYHRPNCSSGTQSSTPQPTPEPTPQPTQPPTSEPRPDLGCQTGPQC